MSFTIDYHPKIPHGTNWSVGYPLDMSCRNYQRVTREKMTNNGNGPRNGVRIILRGLPKYNNQRVYVRFWAALKNSDTWDTHQEAYGESDTNSYEHEPPIDYPNGGLVKARKNGKTHFRVHLPAGYQSENGYISPHLHYRVCIDGKMGPVHTQYFCNARNEANNLMVLRDTNRLERGQQHTHRRLF
jgi:hypothetical protein